MKIHKFKSKHYGFKISIPDNWRRSPVDFLFRLENAIKSVEKKPGKISDSTTVVGPNGRYLNVLITPLLANEPEPTISETEEYFDGLTYRQNLHVIATGTIKVVKKEHFWATYYRMTLIGQKQLEFFKKYCLFLNRVEYLITAGLWSASSGDKLPTDKLLQDTEKIYDNIVTSFELSIG